MLTGGALAAVNHFLGAWTAPSDAIRPRCVATTELGEASLDPEQAANAALIAAVGQARSMSPRAVAIALATAMQESKLRNLDYGDRDSLGLFQQRPSQDWGSPEEIMDPLYSAGEFYSALAQVPGFETMAITEAAQAVQRSAFPDAYANHEIAARSLASTLTGHTPGGLTCVLGSADEPASAARVVGAFRSEWGDAPADLATVADGWAGAGTTPPQPTEVALRADSTTRAWAYAQWAVAKADQLGIDSVTVEGRAWTRSAGVWEAAPSPAEDLGTAGRVTLQLA
jgi:hypothetical protein